MHDRVYLFSIDPLYEDRNSGSITERNYKMMCRRYEDEQAQLEREIAELKARQEESSNDRSNIEQFSRLVKEYAGIDELTAALLNTLIEKITVGEPKDADGEQVQEIKIYYKFIGNIG